MCMFSLCDACWPGVSDYGLLRNKWERCADDSDIAQWAHNESAGMARQSDRDSHRERIKTNQTEVEKKHQAHNCNNNNKNGG